MKRIISLCIIFIMLISAVPIWAAEEYNKIIFWEDFETIQFPYSNFTGNCIDDAFGTDKNGGKCLSATVPSSGDKYFQTKKALVVDSEYGMEKKIKVSYNVKLTGTATAIMDIRANSESSSSGPIWINVGKFNSTGKLSFNNIETDSYTTDWYSFEVYLDFDNELADVYMNGTQVITDKSIADAVGIYALRIQVQDALSGTDVKLMADNIRFAAYGEPPAPPAPPEPEKIYSLDSTVLAENFTGHSTGTFSDTAWEFKQASGILHDIRESEYEATKYGKVLSTNFPETAEGSTTAGTDNMVALLTATVKNAQNYKAGCQFWEMNFDYLFTGKGSMAFNFWGVDESGTSKLVNIANFSGGGNLSVYGGATNNDNFALYEDYETGKWYNIRIYLNLVEDTYSLWIDDNEIVRGNSLQYSLSEFRRPRFDIPTSQGISQNGESRFYLDNMTLSCPEDMVVSRQSISDGYSGFALNGDIVIDFSTDLEVIDNNYITIESNDGSAEFDAGISANTLTVSFANKPLSFNTEYTLTVEKEALKDVFTQKTEEDTVIKFKTMSEGVLSNLPYFTDAAGTAVGTLPNSGNICIKSDIKNYTSAPKSAFLMAALYDAQGNLDTILPGASDEAPANGGEKTLSITLTNTQYSGKTVKAVVVENLTDFKPVSQGFSTISSVEKKEYIAGGITVSVSADNAQTEGKTITLSGNVIPKGTHIIMTAVKDADGVLLAAEPIQTAADGSYSYSYTLSEINAAKPGETRYNFTVNSRQASASANYSAYYINEDTRDDICSSINAAGSMNDVKSIFLTYKNSFNLSSEVFCDSNYQVVYEQRPYQKYEDIVQMIKKSNELLNKIKAITWSDITEFVGTNHAIALFGEETSYAVYDDLSPSKKGAVNKLIADYGSVSTIMDFRTNFSKAVTEKTKVVDDTDFSPSGGGGGGASRVDIAVGTPVKDTAEETKAVFNDIKTVQWAQEAISNLAAKNIVNGYEDGSFRPNDMVKREEFVKILVLGLGIEVRKSSAGFDDVDDNAWYSTYIATAKNAGIVVGGENGKFGVGEYITRQDACVMLWRAIKNTGKTVSGSEKYITFYDENEISDYAKDAVKVLTSMNIINGMEDNTFRPSQTATRAQTAKIIYAMIAEN